MHHDEAQARFGAIPDSFFVRCNMYTFEPLSLICCEMILMNGADAPDGYLSYRSPTPRIRNSGLAKFASTPLWYLNPD